MALPFQGHAGLGPDPLGQGGHHPAHPQHHGESAHVADVLDREGEARRDEEEVQGRHAQDRGQQRGPAPGAGGHHGDAQDIEHGHIGQVQAPEDDEPPGRGQGHRRQGGHQRPGILAHDNSPPMGGG